MILVPADADGFSYTPVHTVAGVGTSATYYEDVRVPVANLVGELNGGWPLMTNQLNHERVALTSAAPLTHSIGLVRSWAQETKDPDGQRVIDAEWVQIAARPGPRAGRDADPAQLEDRLVTSTTSPPPTPRRPRSTARSSPPRSTARSWRSSAPTPR